MGVRRAPAYSTKLCSLPSGARADRLGAVLVALQSCEQQPGRLSIVTLADGSISIYRSRYGVHS